MIRYFDCPHCGLPTPMCSCSTPDSVYYPAELVRTDIRIERLVSPEEGLSDYDKSEAFVKDYLTGVI